MLNNLDASGKCSYFPLGSFKIGHVSVWWIFQAFQNLHPKEKKTHPEIHPVFFFNTLTTFALALT